MASIWTPIIHNMFYTALLLLAIIGYLAATALIAKKIKSQTDPAPVENVKSTSINSVFVIATISVIAHLAYAFEISKVGSSINFSLSSMACLVSLVMTIVFLLGSLKMPIRTLGVLVFPLTAISLIFSFFWGNTVSNQNPLAGGIGLAFASHIFIAILAYCFIAIAAIQSLLYVYQERLIKKRTSSAMLLTLPPLQTMETLLFRLVLVGFILLSFTLLTGTFFSQQIFGQAFAFNHHTLLSILSWVVLGILLIKRYKSGLRGSQAVKWTIAGFLLMQLGYFGTKIVSESLNIQ
ncbi:MAG: cytochrome c biogenesis protein CcsA [Acidiferrobacterales bacterium]|nr:cytochrome c biogenesis protein CcsA [Acidiferrobacterales bacterium]